MSIANIVMEKVEQMALELFIHLPSLWIIYDDDTFVIMNSDVIERFHDHFNNIALRFKFTTEVEKDDFLDFLRNEKFRLCSMKRCVNH